MVQTGSVLETRRLGEKEWDHDPKVSNPKEENYDDDDDYVSACKIIMVVNAPEVVHSRPSMLELSVLNTHLPGTPIFDVVSISTTAAV